jgi:diguanylate cyclase (GGDEF)-like protein/PAS domain S-box-containing protein
MHRPRTEQTTSGVGVRGIAQVAIWLLFGLAIAAQVTLMAIILSGHGADSPLRTEVLVTVTMAAAACGTLLAGVVGSGGRVRWPWLVLGAGLLSYAVGEGYFFFFQKTLTTFPTTADFFWLAVYPFVLAAIVLLVREQRQTDRLGISLDATIVALAVGALAYELLFDRFLNVDEVSGLVGGQLSYSVLDLAVVTMLVLVAAQSRGRAGNAYAFLGLGALAFLATDLANVKILVTDSYMPGTMLDAGWPAGVLLLGLACRFGTSLRSVGALRGRRLYAAVIFSFAIAVVLLLEETLDGHEGAGHNLIVIALAALVLCLILARLVLSVREIDRLARDNEGIIAAAGEGIVRVDLHGRITYANPAALEMLGYTPAEVLGERSHELFHHTRPNGTPYPAAECPAHTSLTEGATHRVSDEIYWRKDGSSIAVDYTTSPVREGGRIVGVVTVFDDVTHQRQLQEQLHHQADHDSLTGLYNRRRFGEEVSGQLSYAQRYSRPGVLLLMDLDSFKFVNDSYGHPVGDKLLCDVAAILTSKLRETDVVARLGGDEFSVLLREATEFEGVQVAKGLIAAIRSESEPSVGASFGVAPFDGAGERTADELLISADVALYEVKEAGGGEVAVFSGQNGQALTWVERIRAALDEGRLVVYSQPIIDLRTEETIREELLVRMIDPDGDAIPPASFMPAAERFGLIHEIDLLVLREAIRLARGGKALAVNVSARSLGDPRYIETLEEAIEGGLDPRLFNFEITETAAVANMADAQEFARRIRILGASLALDDFGTGFSSFTYLKEIPAQILKIDVEFVRELRRSPADQQLVQAIVSIARGLGQKTVAEGIEDEDTLALARKLGVDYGQGFYIGRPERAATASSPTRFPGQAGRAPA